MPDRSNVRQTLIKLKANLSLNVMELAQYCDVRVKDESIHDFLILFFRSKCLQ